MFKVKVEIVTGFLSSGKTAFINSLINKTLIKNEKIVILLCEQGSTSVDITLEKKENINVKYIKVNEEITEEMLFDIYKYEKPDRLIIEFNGTKDLKELATVINNRIIKKIYRVNTIYNLIDCSTFNIFLSNMGSILISPIKYSNIVLLNSRDKVNDKEINIIKSKILKINSTCYMVEADNTNTIEKVVKESNLFYIDIVDKLKLKLENYRRKSYGR
ncbi:GTP-binding protein [Clostridium baratii]|uniref:GTP-binding protein n=1 Tax=Clostridium baratii TaxID=1561 RepID=UPI003D3271E8